MNRRSQMGWMTLGGLLCLFGVVLACKLRDGNRALASGETTGSVVVSEKPAPPPATVAELPPVTEEPSSSTPSPSTIPPVPPSMPTPPLPGTALPQIKVTGATTPAEPDKGSATLPPPPSPSSTPPSPTVASVPGEGDSRPIVIPASGTVPVTSPLPGSIPTPAPATAPAPASTPIPLSASTAEVTGTLPSTEGQPLPPITSPIPDRDNLSNPAGVSRPATTPTPSTLREPRRAERSKDHPGEPPLAPTPGPVIQYKVPRSGETLRTLARQTLGSSERWVDIHKLNPTMQPEQTILAGTQIRLPGDACLPEDGEAIRPLPQLRARSTPRPRTVLPLTGTYSLTLDDQKMMTLPRAILEQLGNCDTVLVSPGSDRCLWLTNQAHLDRLQAKLDKSPARESEVRGFKRLYYAQTVKVPLREGRVGISEKLASFAGLGTELVLVGIDDHFEIWDAARWRRYTQSKKAATDD